MTGRQIESLSPPLRSPRLSSWNLLTHELTANGERKQSRLNRTQNGFEQHHCLRGSRCWFWFRSLQCYHAHAVGQCATEFQRRANVIAFRNHGVSFAREPRLPAGEANL